ncbi:MAG: hypothetical protein HWE24_16690 [Oceanospirillaceae bacterium]|nr:hypothetical protein [Oceanospirillaceae bacterium]
MNGPYFDLIYNTADYEWMAICFLSIPLVVLFIFYRVIDPAIGKRWHYILTMTIHFVLVSVASYFILREGSLLEEFLNYTPENSTLSNPNAFALSVGAVMGLCGLIISFFPYTFLLKSFASTNNRKNPF